jgi:hypothetical protein
MKANINRWLKYLGFLFVLILLAILINDFLRRGIFESKTGINLLVVGDDNVGLMIIRPEENIVSWISLPTNLKMKITGNNAMYPITSLWGFGVSEKNPYQIAEKSVGENLGVFIPKMIKIDHAANVENLLGKFLSIGLSTDLTIRDRWLIRNIVSEAAVSKRIFELEIPSSAFDKITEADGKEFLVSNKIIDVWSKDKFYHNDVMEESAEVSVNNMSTVTGAGLALSEQLDASGFRVVDVLNNANDDVKSKGCHFLADDRYQISIKYLIDQVGCQPISKNEGKIEEANLIKIWLK